MSQQYDSTADTLKHILRIQELMIQVIGILAERARVHDQTKLQSPEKELFDEMTPILKDLKYGSEEYKESLKKLQVAIDHHYKHNSHHPQHYKDGIDGMDLFDVLEMFIDWKASGERNSGGDIYESIKINKERFKMSEQLVNIFNNTAKNLNF